MPRDRSASPRRRSHDRSRSRRSRSRSPRRRQRHRRTRDRSMPKHRIPENWEDVPKMGTLIGTSRFVGLRVPLDDKYLPFFKDKPDEIWTVSRFLEAQHAEEFNVKMVIDLTNTFKYYDGVKEFADSGVEYVKLKIEGFKGPPAKKDVEQFMEIVDTFFTDNTEGTIAVHCTHGLNRTGYLIVNYMVEKQGFTVTEALEAFKLARPPGLIKHMYVEELYQRLGPKEEVRLPELPDWAATKYGKRRFNTGKHSGRRSEKYSGERSGRRSDKHTDKPNGKHTRFEETE